MIRVRYHYWARIRHGGCSQILQELFCIWSFKLNDCIYDTLLFPSHTIKTNRYLVLLAPPLINASMANLWAKKAVDLEMSMNQKLFYRPWRLKILFYLFFSAWNVIVYMFVYIFFLRSRIFSRLDSVSRATLFLRSKNWNFQISARSKSCQTLS